MSKPITDIAVLVQATLFAALSWLVPKRRGQIVFYPVFEPSKYAGNLRGLFEEMAAHPQPGRSLLWLTRNRALAARLREQGRRVHVYRGRPLWTLLRADLIVTDSTESRIGFGRFRIVQTWHGAGFKRIGLENEGRSGIRRTALKGHFERYVLIVASSEDDAARKDRCFANPNVRVLGTPDNDALLAEAGEDGPLATRLSLDGSQTVIAYCPTYRETGDARPFTPEGWQAIDAWLGQAGAVLLVKRHRHDKALSVPEGLTHVRDVSGEVEDVQQLLRLTDLLISDYSSITTNFALTGRPMIFFTYDAEAYQARCRTLHYDLFETLPGPFAADEAALLALLADRSWFDDPAYRQRYQAFRRRFHAFADAGSARRVADAIRALPLVSEM